MAETYFVDFYRDRARLKAIITYAADDDEAIKEASAIMDANPHYTMCIIDKCTGPGRFASVATITENLLPTAVIIEGQHYGL